MGEEEFFVVRVGYVVVCDIVVFGTFDEDAVGVLSFDFEDDIALMECGEVVFE